MYVWRKRQQYTCDLANVSSFYLQEQRKEMASACEMLTVAGQDFLFATQNAQILNFTQSSRKHLITAAKNVLEGTLKVCSRLQLADPVMIN